MGGAGVIQVASAVFNAIGKPTPSIIMTIARMFVFYIPLAYVGSRVAGPMGIFIAALVSNLAVGLGAYIWNQRTCYNPPTVELAKQEALNQ